MRSLRLLSPRRPSFLWVVMIVLLLNGTTLPAPTIYEHEVTQENLLGESKAIYKATPTQTLPPTFVTTNHPPNPAGTINIFMEHLIARAGIPIGAKPVPVTVPKKPVTKPKGTRPHPQGQPSVPDTPDPPKAPAVPDTPDPPKAAVPKPSKPPRKGKYVWWAEDHPNGPIDPDHLIGPGPAVPRTGKKSKKVGNRGAKKAPVKGPRRPPGHPFSNTYSTVSAAVTHFHPSGTTLVPDVATTAIDSRPKPPKQPTARPVPTAPFLSKPPPPGATSSAGVT